MNREIKFRGQQIETKEWRYGFLSKRSDYHTIREQEIKDCAYHTYDVISETVGQFTGLKDKNGVDIYEGDIVEFNLEPGAGSEDKKTNLEGVVKIEPTCLVFGNWQALYCSNIEIIGNIHQNPELLNNK